MVVLLKDVLLTVLLFSVKTTLLIAVLSCKCLLLIKNLKYGILSKMILDNLCLKEMDLGSQNVKIIILNPTLNSNSRLKNYKAIKLFCCNLNGDEFERIFSYTSAHEIWN